jgi:hypothetical protein
MPPAQSRRMNLNVGATALAPVFPDCVSRVTAPNTLGIR